MDKLLLFCLAWLFSFLLHLLISQIKFILSLKIFYRQKLGRRRVGDLFWEGLIGSCSVTLLLVVLILILWSRSCSPSSALWNCFFSPRLYSLFFRSKSLLSEYVRAQLLSHVRLFVTLYTVACQAPLSMGLSQSATLKEVGKRWWASLPGIYTQIILNSSVRKICFFSTLIFLSIYPSIHWFISAWTHVYLFYIFCCNTIFMIYFVAQLFHFQPLATYLEWLLCPLDKPHPLIFEYFFTFTH